MKRFLFVGLLNLCASVLLAHNSKIATYTLRDTGQGWFIEMAFAQASIDDAMERLYGAEIAQLSQDEYKREVIRYIKTHFHLVVDGMDVTLGGGGISLGSHQTNLKFVLPDMPSSPQDMDVAIPAFEHSYNHTNIFRLYRGGGQFSKAFLSSDNDFSVSVTIEGSNFIEIEKKADDTIAFSLIAAIGLGAILLIGLGFYLKKQFLAT